MTPEEWLGAKSPQPPAALASALLAAVRTARTEQATMPDRFVTASAQLLPEVIENGCESRSGALGLLTLDALLTHAMETGLGSADECERTASAALAVLGQGAQSLRKARGK